MQYDNIRRGQFISRPNRFIANILVNGKEEICHVKNTGRCTELLVPGAIIFVREVKNDRRRTKFDLVSVFKGERLVNIDSQIPNNIFREWIESNNYFPGLSLVKPEYKYRNSRLDYYLEAGDQKIMVEIKGVTLEKDGAAFFPDAPTERGIKHINDLCHAITEGYEAYLIFIIQMKNVLYFAPNRETHPAFADAVLRSVDMGVQLLALDCDVTADSITVGNYVKVKAEG